MVKKWYKPKTHSGWSKDQSPSVRRAHLIASTPKNWSLHKRRLSAGRKIQALANITKDKTTEIKARADAKYFFRMLK